MCLYPRLVQNKRYITNKKNGGIIPAVTDTRVLHVPKKCGKCEECVKQKRREWQVRLSEEIKTRPYTFVTLTLSNESYSKLSELVPLKGYERENAIAALAVRRFTERWRDQTGKAPRHFLTTELGHQGTENIHLHGLIESRNIKLITEKWKYGFVWPNEETINLNYVNQRTINYIVKYIGKIDREHKNYNPRIFASKGIGKNYLTSLNAKLNKYSANTDESYKLANGTNINLPTYYRNKIYTDIEKEKLWIEKLDKNIRYVNGIKIDTSKGEEEYYKILKYQQKLSESKGYGTDKINWKEKEYENQRRDWLNKMRTNNAKIKPKKNEIIKWETDGEIEIIEGKTYLLTSIGKMLIEP